MAWLSQQSHDMINANLTNLENIYQQCKPGLLALNSGAFASQPDDHLRFAFCALTAFDLKPYIGSMAYSLKDLMMEDGLDCDNYVRLAWYFFQVMRPTSTSEVAAVGWEGGTIGNHAQMQIRTSGQPSMYCDPTIGVMVNGVDFDKLCTGYQVPGNHVYSIYSFNPRAAVSTLHTNALSALSGGTYKASQLLYVYTNMTKYNTLDRKALGTYPVRNEY